MIRIGICDDSIEQITQIQTMIQYWSNKPANLVIEYFLNGDSLIETHKNHPFQIILLDIIMPMLDGLDTARELRRFDKNVKIIFLTSSSEYGVDSYEVKATNYLLKPVNPNKLYECLEEIMSELRHKSKSIQLRTSNSIIQVNLDSIEYIEAQNKLMKIVLSDKSMIASLDPLYTFENKLSLEEGFYKCHRSYIVNIYQIDTYTNKEIQMRSGCRIPISRSFHKNFEKAYFSVIFNKAGEDS